ncbi:hypothetical protein D9756_008187 [Leucocoprinus leucothites]|uniref:Glutamine amidotransferase domain-containing protein n=1 Tax=Leucocoprinus leucothites TaxID=201217 RepID=A0A8H5FWC6_9AGAR|nr:hypothetical protein D9756_008187 [Leucoagaricus leucothites]
MTPPPRTIRIGLLICGSLSGPVEAVHGGYHEIYSHYWKSTIPRGSNASVIIDSYSIKNMEFPDEDRLDEYDIFMVTGSATSACDDTIPWVRELLAFLKGLVQNHPKVKLCGICFGHQIVSRALGGDCVLNDQWEIGPIPIALSEAGKSVFGVDQLTLQQIHRDHVPVESFSKHLTSGEIELVGSTGPTPNQGIIKFYPSTSGDAIKTPRNVHVLTLQGHPEFSEGIITGLVRQRVDAFGLPTVTEYWGHKGGEDAHEPTDKEGTGRRWHKTDGADIVSQALWKMLGVAPDSVDAHDKPKHKGDTTSTSHEGGALGIICSSETVGKSSFSSWWRLTDGLSHISNLLWRVFGLASWW